MDSFFKVFVISEVSTTQMRREVAKLKDLAQAWPDCATTLGATPLCTCVTRVSHTLHGGLSPNPQLTRGG